MVVDAVAHLLPDGGVREYDDAERAVIEDVLDAAEEWRAGRLPIEAFWRIGTLFPRRWSGHGMTCHGQDCGEYSRFVALVWAQRACDPRRLALMGALDAGHAAGLIRPRTAGM